MDHVTVPATVRITDGADAVMLEVGFVDGWLMITSAEVGGPSFTVDTCTWRRLVAASEDVGAHLGEGGMYGAPNPVVP